MDSKRFLEILEEYYGDQAVFLIAAKNKELGLLGVESQTKEQRITLTNSITDDLKRILSEKHVAMIERKIKIALS